MYWLPESGNIDPSSAKAAQAHSEIAPPRIQTRKNQNGCGNGPAMSLAVRKIEEPMIPLTSSNTESSKLSPRTRLGLSLGASFCEVWETGAELISYPIPSSSEDSSGVPQRRQITEAQSPQVSGSSTCFAQTGQYRISEDFWGAGALCWLESISEETLAQL